MDQDKKLTCFLIFIKLLVKSMWIFIARGKPRYISLIDSKIAVILRGGYKSLERCKMGIGEFAFAPSGNVYPCERLIGSDDWRKSIALEILMKVLFRNGKCERTSTVAIAAVNNECQICGYERIIV